MNRKETNAKIQPYFRFVIVSKDLRDFRVKLNT